MQVRVNVQLLPDYRGEEAAVKRVVEELVKGGFIVERVLPGLRLITGVTDFETLGDLKKVAGVERVGIDRQVTTP